MAKGFRGGGGGGGMPAMAAEEERDKFLGGEGSGVGSYVARLPRFPTRAEERARCAC
jgi:hypothetical protein